MPHLHGIAWFNTESESIKKFKCFNEDNSFNLDHEDLPKLINEWSSCSLNHDCEKLNTMVEELNIHSHTDSCMKKGNGCRFDFPKLPSYMPLKFSLCKVFKELFWNVVSCTNLTSLYKM